VSADVKRVKEDLVDSDRIEGKTKQAEGKLQEEWGKAKDKARDAADDAEDAVEDALDRDRDKDADKEQERR